MIRSSSLSAIALAAVVLSPMALAPLAPAQIPAGCFVLACEDAPLPNFYPWTGPSGLFIGHPRNPGAMATVTGLPPALWARPASFSTSYWGIGGIAIHEPTGDLLVGNAAAPFGSLDLYRLHISASNTTPPAYSATVVATVNLGTGNGVAGTTPMVTHLAMLDDNRVLVTCNDVIAGPVGAGPMQIAEVDLTTLAVTPWTAVSATFTASYMARAVCVDRVNGFAYFGGSPGGALPPGQIYQVPLVSPPATPSTITVIQPSLPIYLNQLRLERSGTLLASGRLNSASSQSLWRVVPAAGGTATAVGPAGPFNMPCFDLEDATGDILFAGVAGSLNGVYHWTLGSASAPTFLTNSDAAGMVGLPWAFEVMPDPAPYGVATVNVPGAPLLPWSRDPLPGGLPLLGNNNFALQLEVPPSTTFLAGLLFASFDAAPGTTIAGTAWNQYVNLSPGVFITSLGMSALPPGNQGLPVPNVPNLQGLQIFFQALTIASYNGGANIAWGASDGLKVRIL